MMKVECREDKILDALCELINRWMPVKEKRFVGNKEVEIGLEFLSYSYHMLKELSLTARQGSMVTDYDNWNRDAYVTTEIRVGDSVNGAGLAYNTVSVPLRTNASSIVSLKRIVDEITDSSFKLSLLNYFSKHMVASSIKGDVFEHLIELEPQKYLQTIAPTEVDTKRIADALEKYSEKLYKTWLVTDAIFSGVVKEWTRRFASSEGTLIRDSSSRSDITFSASVEAFDGHWEDISESHYAFTLDELLDERKLDLIYNSLLERVRTLKECRLIQETDTYPALFDNRGVDVILHEAVAAHLLSAQYILGEHSTIFGLDKLGKKVLPGNITLIDDPTLPNQWGSYMFDDEGVKSRRVVLVKDGRVINYLNNRNTAYKLMKRLGKRFEPGQARLEVGEENAPEPRISNLIVSAKQKMKKDELWREFARIIQKSGNDYGIIFYGGGGEVETKEGFNIHLPKYITRFYPSSGKIVPVVRAHSTGEPYLLLNNIVALGGATKTSQGFCGAESGWVPVSTKSPWAVIKEVQFVREEESIIRERLLKPIY